MDDLLFGVLSYQWLEFKCCSIKASTYARYTRVIFKYIDPMIGHLLCHEMNENDIIKFINELHKKNLNSKSIQDISVIVKSIIKYGNMKKVMTLTLGLIPCPKVNFKKIRVLSSNEVNSIEKYLNDHTDYKNLGILLSLYTGMRLGEICALSWSDINLKQGSIEVTKTMQRIYIGKKTKVIISDPKTDTSHREIPICEQLFKVLKSIELKEGYILSGSNKYIEPRSMQRYFQKVMRNLNIQDVHFHVLRHTFATYCVQCDVDVKSLSEILGHSSVSITLNRYVHSSFDLKTNQMKKLSYRS